MNIVTTTSVFPKEYPSQEALKRLCRIGYTVLDMAFDYCSYAGHPFMSEERAEWARELRREADRLGVRYTHSHAPGVASVLDRRLGWCMELCGILGIRYLVIHPVFRIDGENITDRETFIRVNAEAIRELLPKAQRHGVTILSENLLWGASIDPRIIADTVKEVGHPNFGWCFDTGHANCHKIPISVLRKVSVVPLSLHIHDNCGEGGRDEHLLPGDGTIDWRSFLDLLNEIGYGGELVLEAHHQSLEARDADRDAILSELLRRSRSMLAYSASGEQLCKALLQKS